MRIPNQRLTDLLNGKGQLRDRHTKETILCPADVKGETILFVTPNGKSLVLEVTKFEVHCPPDGFPTTTITANVVGHTTAAGVLGNSERLEIAPMPQKQTKRIIEDA